MAGEFNSFPIPYKELSNFAVANKESYAELRATDTSTLKAGDILYCKSFYTEDEINALAADQRSTQTRQRTYLKGGGDFFFTPTILTDFGGGVFPADDGGGSFVYCPHQEITPFHFGALDDSRDQVNVDSVDQLEKYFDFVRAREWSDAYPKKVRGRFGLTRTLQINDLSSNIEFDVHFDAMNFMVDTVNISHIARGTVWSGIISTKGTGGSSLSVGTGTIHGVRLDRVPGKLCDFTTYGYNGWGVYHATGSSNMCEIGSIKAENCGSSVRDTRNHTVMIDAVTHDDSPNIHQRSYLTLSADSVIPPDEYLLTYSFLIAPHTEYLQRKCKKLPYKVMGVDRETRTIEIYPRLANPVEGDDQSIVGKAMGWVFGGGALMHAMSELGAAYQRAGQMRAVTTTRCGIGLWLAEIYPLGVEGITGQFNGIGLVLGNGVLNHYQGTFIQRLYEEAHVVSPIVHVTQQRSSTASGNHVFIGSLQHVSSEDFVSLMPQSGSGTLRGSVIPHFPVSYPFGNRLVTPSDIPRRGAGSDETWLHTTTADATHSHTQWGNYGNGTKRIRLSHDDAANWLRGTKHLQHIVTGSGPKGEHIGEMEVACAEDFTINNKPGPLVIPRQFVPYTINAMVNYGNNWTVSIEKHSVPYGAGSYSGAIMDSKPFAHWSFNEGRETSYLYDDVENYLMRGTNNSGNLNQFTFTDSIDPSMGPALTFSPHNGARWEIQDSVDWPINKAGQPFTIEFWMICNGGGRYGLGRVLSTEGGGSTGFGIWHASNKLELSGGFQTDAFITYGEKAHVMLTHDGTTTRWIVNGEERATTDSFSVTPSTTNIFLGNNPGADREWDGVLDEITFYDRAVSVAKAKEHYETIVPPAA